MNQVEYLLLSSEKVLNRFYPRESINTNKYFINPDKIGIDFRADSSLEINLLSSAINL